MEDDFWMMRESSSHQLSDFKIYFSLRFW